MNDYSLEWRDMAIENVLTDLRSIDAGVWERRWGERACAVIVRLQAENSALRLAGLTAGLDRKLPVEPYVLFGPELVAITGLRWRLG